MRNLMAEKPQMSSYSRHILICTGQYCDPEGKAAVIYRKLPVLLGEMGQYDNPQRVKRGTCPCLGVCSGGPLLVVYPDGVWYCHVDETLLARIVDEHLIDGRVVEEAVFYRMSRDDES
jgi:(2Fe-2S) ferredoxin